MTILSDLHQFWVNYWTAWGRRRIHHTAPSFDRKRSMNIMISQREMFSGIYFALHKPLVLSDVTEFPAPDQEDSHAFVPMTPAEGVDRTVSRLSVSHTLFLQPEPQNPQQQPTEYTFGMTSENPLGKFDARIDSSRNFTAGMALKLSPSIFVDAHYYGMHKMWTTTLKHFRGASLYRFQYGVMGKLTMAYTTRLTGGLTSGVSIDYGLNDRKSNLSAFVNRLNSKSEMGTEFSLKDTGGSNEREAKVWYSRRATAKTTLGTEFSWNFTQRTAKYRSGFMFQYQHGRVRTTVDPNLNIFTMIDHQFGQFQFSLAIAASPDKGDFKFGFGIQSS